MALIAIATYVTPENERFPISTLCIKHLRFSIDPAKDRVIIVDNGSQEEWLGFLKEYAKAYHVIHYFANEGTAKAINRAWVTASSGEVTIKMDDDVLIHGDDTWVRLIEEAMWRDKTIGLLGLKRKDLAERPDAEKDWFRTELHMVPHNAGERWIVVERAKHIMGTCMAVSPELRAKIGYLYQPGLYGWDDSDYCLRARLASFHPAFLPQVEIDHIDPGGTKYTKDKVDQAGITQKIVSETFGNYQSGKLSIYRPSGL